MNMESLLIQSVDNVLKKIKNEALGGEIYIENTQTFKIVVEPDRIDEIHTGDETGLAIRIIEPNFATNFYTTHVEPNFLSKKFSISFNKENNSLGEEKLSERLQFLEEIKKHILQEPCIKHYKIIFVETKKQVFIFLPEKEPVSEERKYIRVGCLVVAEKDGKIERGYESLGYLLSFEEIKNREDFILIGKKASELAKKMLFAKRAPAGVMPVILAGEAGGTMIHEAVGHGLEADHAEEGFSVYSGRLGEKVASEYITVIDDPGLFPLYGSYQYDDEGFPAKKVVLIEKGYLKNFLYDKLTALKYGKEQNGHGRRESFKHIPIPRMANTYIAKGPHNPEEILKSIDKGLLVKKMGGGEVNPLTGDFVFEVREGYYIEKGEIAYMVKGATLVGNGPEVLKKIDMVGNDLSFEAGTCGKDGQGVPVSDGQPTLRIPELTVGGTLS